jgi:hypothetical protein
MMQDLAAASGDPAVVIGVMLLFIAAFAFIVIRVWRTGKDVDQRRARLPLDDGTPTERDEHPE